jgi:hypothetical protein
MRKDWGLPEPPAPTNNSPSKLLDASSGPGSSSSSSSSSNAPSFSAVDAFVSQTTGGGDPNNVANAGDFKDNDHPDGLGNGPKNNSSAPAPPSGFPGMVVPPPPAPSMEPQGDRTRPEGIIGQYWDRYSMTSTKLRMQRKGNTDTLPLFQSAIIQSSADKLLVQMSLPSPASMLLENLNIDPSLRDVEDIQTSIMEKLQDLNVAEAEDGEPEIGLMFVFKSKDYIFGSFVEKKFKFHLAEADMPAEVIGSHYGSKNNHMFSVTHDLKIPYNGRVREKVPQPEYKQWGNVDEDTGEWEPFTTNPYNTTGWESFFADVGVLRFGQTDLILNKNLDTCSSNLESSFGCSFRRPLRSTILAGSERFSIDQLEVFYVTKETGGYQEHGDEYNNLGY